MPRSPYRCLLVSIAALSLIFVASPAHAASRLLWSQVFESGSANDLALAPDGTALYLTGCNPAFCGGAVQTVAYSVGSGRQLWSASFQGTFGYGRAIVASPDGKRVFVTGSATIAYDAATGAQLWSAHYFGSHIGVSPDGTKVFVTNEISYPGQNNFQTNALDAATGSLRWQSLYGPVNGVTGTTGLAVSPDGSTVVVTGGSYGPDLYNDYVTLAYDATTGSQRWAAQYNNPNKGGDTPYGVAISPDSSRVFVTGCQGSIDSCVDGDYLTIAYDISAGNQLWLSTYNGPVNGIDTAYADAISPDGSLLFVTGTSNQTGGFDAVTIAYDTATGSQRWLAAYRAGSGREGTACCLAVSADGSRLIVAGADFSQNADIAYRAIAYNPTTGSMLWTSRFSGGGFYSAATGVAVTRNGQVALVGGTTIGPDDQYDFGTVAFRA